MALALLALTACGGGDAPAAKGPLEVQADLSEFKIESPVTSFDVGTRYRFVVKNSGVVNHEWAIAPRGVADHARMLVHVLDKELPPKASITREFTFRLAGSYEFACHLPGHYEAGMKQDITVKR
ncbi:MAG: hypothetical protein HY686_08225 [Chloroflexi bacterium]|nr:hypothetical protein [Chloroflexota bacterium]